MSQYLRIMSLKMRWPWIWATFGIQTEAIPFWDRNQLFVTLTNNYMRCCSDSLVFYFRNELLTIGWSTRITCYLLTGFFLFLEYLLVVGPLVHCCSFYLSGNAISDIASTCLPQSIDRNFLYSSVLALGKVRGKMWNCLRSVHLPVGSPWECE